MSTDMNNEAAQLGTKLLALRKKMGISQEKLAAELNVSRQAIQKWETGVSMPDTANLIALTKVFDVSADWLLSRQDTRSTEEMRVSRKLYPDFENRHVWEAYYSQLEVEYAQCEEEGKVIAPLKGLMDAVSGLPQSPEKEKLADVIFNMILNAPQRADYAYIEPSAYDDIASASKGCEAVPCPDRKKLRDRIYGAWLGRACGCMLGKAVEGVKVNELHSFLKETGNWPMHRYILSTDTTPEVCSKYSFPFGKTAMVDVDKCMPADDDTNYTVIGSLVVSRYGRSFTPRDVADIWVSVQSKNAYCTAERVAFRNFMDGYLPPFSAEYKNPYREWIGAQIRADYWGYINPGDPVAAAEMAWRDACISHVKNGIYGEMYFAAAIAAAACADSIEDVLTEALKVIPASSRLAEGIRLVMSEKASGVSEDACFERIHKEFNEYSQHTWCHTISNAEIVIASLLYGGGNFGRTICLAVQQGFDTDCNGATAGSVLGMFKGASAMPSDWVAPLNDTLVTTIFGVGKVTFSEMADKTLSHIPDLQA